MKHIRLIIECESCVLCMWWPIQYNIVRYNSNRRLIINKCVFLWMFMLRAVRVYDVTPRRDEIHFFSVVCWFRLLQLYFAQAQCSVQKRLNGTKKKIILFFGFFCFCLSLSFCWSSANNKIWMWVDIIKRNTTESQHRREGKRTVKESTK